MLFETFIFTNLSHR